MAENAARDEWVDDDGDVCRVCRTEAEEGKPLIHPCKCSGSVRYVHSDCLQEWLSHNGKRYCEICSHHYTFSKVYPIALPSRIPAAVYARQSLIIALKLAWGIARICIAICSWLVVLPIITMCCLRIIMYFADNVSYASVAYGIRNVITDSHAELNKTFVLPSVNESAVNGTASNVTITGRDRVLGMIAQNSTADILPYLSDRIASDAKNLVAFVFRGQIVAISVATGLIGLVLLREWITQLEWHARPPIQEEGEIVLNQWAFRNGQAIRLNETAGLSDVESNHADAGYDTATEGGEGFGGAEPDGDGSTAVGDAEDEEHGPATANTARQVRPTPAHDQARAFAAPELIGKGEGVADRRSVPEAGPSSRPLADVPEDVSSETPSPLFQSPAWNPNPNGDPRHESVGHREHGGNPDADERPVEQDTNRDDNDSRHPSGSDSGGHDAASWMAAWDAENPVPPSYAGLTRIPREGDVAGNARYNAILDELAEYSARRMAVLSSRPWERAPNGSGGHNVDNRDSSPGQHIEEDSRFPPGLEDASDYDADGQIAAWDAANPPPPTYPGIARIPRDGDVAGHARYNAILNELAEYNARRNAFLTSGRQQPAQNGNQQNGKPAQDGQDEKDEEGEKDETVEQHEPAPDNQAEPSTAGDESFHASSPATDSPETPGSPGSGVYSDAEYEEDNLHRAVAAAADQFRNQERPLPIFDNGPRRGGANAGEGEEQVDDAAQEEVAPEGPDPGWEFVDNDDFVVNAEFVERVMAVNNMDAAGMEILPEDDDDRPLDADDWDGILGVIGFIGPLTDLLHNHIFVSIAMTLTLSTLVGVPVILGKIILATDAIRAARDLYYFNMSTISLLSNLILTIVGWGLREVLVLPRMVIKTMAKYIFETVGIDTFDDIDYIGGAFNFSSSPFSGYSHDTVRTLQYAAEMPVVGPVADKVLDGLELLGRTAHELYKAYRLKAISIAASPDSRDQLLCMLVGYASMSCAVLAVAIADAANLLNLSPGLMDKARNIQMFLKVVFFMSLEIVCFPIFIGFAMDLTTLSLFGATVGDRLARLGHRPFGTIFVLWASGTVFMISFASFLTHMKKKGCRPGALYFIRDPSDPSHSPVKEIMDRPALAQLPRLAVSASMYFIVVFSVCGAVPCSLWALGKCTTLFRDFLPLRLEQRPLSSVPFDLLFLHLVLPPSWEGLDMNRRFRKAFLIWWTFIVSSVDLSSLIFGIQSRAYPQSKSSQAAWIVCDAICQFLFGRYDNRASRARVPNNDRLELTSPNERRRENVFIPLDHTGAPKTEADKLRLLRQDRIARNAGRNPRTDYTTVMLPEHWRTRVYALLAIILLSAAALVVVVFFIPLAIGRQAAAFAFDGPIYDGYSWIIGVYLCLGSFTVGRSVRKHIVEFNRAERLRRSNKSARVKRTLFSMARGIYSIVMLYLVLPMLVGINFELFVSLPARYGFSTDLTPVLHLWDAWATGAALLSLYVGAVGMAVEDQVQVPRGNRLRDAFRKPLRQRFTTLTSILMPPIAWLLMVILLPWLLLSGIWTGMQLIGVPLPPLDITFRMTFPMSWTMLLVLMSWRAIKATFNRIRQWMIDAEYVVAEQVENYEPDTPASVELIPGTVYEVIDGEMGEAVVDQSDGEGEAEWEDIAVE